MMLTPEEKLTAEEKKRVEVLAAEVMEVAQRQAHRKRELGSDLEEAALSPGRVLP